MTDEERAALHALTLRLRRTHQKLFDIQGETIRALQHAIIAIQDEHEEMMAFFQAINDVDDLGSQ